MDVKYFKPIKRTEENSIEEWLILCLISQTEARPTEAGLGFGQRVGCHRATPGTRKTHPARTGGGLRRGLKEATVLQTPLPPPLAHPGVSCLHLVAFQPRNIQALQRPDMFVFLSANFIKVWGRYYPDHKSKGSLICISSKPYDFIC